MDLPHKLYQTAFSPEFVATLAPALRPCVDWVEPFVREHIAAVGDDSTQSWIYGTRRGHDTVSGQRMADRVGKFGKL